MFESLLRQMVALTTLLRTAFANAAPGLMAALFIHWTPVGQTTEPRRTAAQAEKSLTAVAAPIAGDHAGGVAPKADDLPGVGLRGSVSGGQRSYLIQYPAAP